MKYSPRTQFPVVFFASAVLFTALMFGQSTLAHLNVSSVRKATKYELTLTSSGPGEKWIVRFSLELSAEQGAYLLVLGPKGAPPADSRAECVAELSRAPVAGISPMNDLP